MKNDENRIGTEKSEHILVCLSASPSNARIVNAAAKMAAAFKGSFTALYVETPDFEKMDEESKKRLQYHIKLAEDAGANVTTLHGRDVSYQIAEYARISGITKVVIGRSNTRRRRFFGKPTLTERLIEIAPDLDIHIIPDGASKVRYSEGSHPILKSLIPYPDDLLVMLAVTAGATLLGTAFYELGFTDSNIITVYILGVLLTSLFTKGYACGVIGSLISVMLFNFCFTEPRLTFHAYDSGYPVTFVIMLAASIITGTLASKLKSHAKLSAQAAFRTKVLLDTNMLLQKAKDGDDIVNTAATQLMKLLSRTVIVYSAKGGVLSKGSLFSIQPLDNEEELLSESEQTVAEWVYTNKHRAGNTTDKYPNAKCLYLAIRINDRVYGVVGIAMNDKALDSFETNILLSILGECALALDNNRNAKEKELAAVLAKNEQLRADLLRAISHDLRTPLTSISGNASNLLSNYDKLDEETKKQVFTDIYDDSQWLITLVENLLSVTRLEEGRMNFNMSVHLMDELIEEALKHVDRKSSEHKISVECKGDLLLVRADAKLIIQVIINLIDNAVKYTEKGSNISVTAQREGDFVSVSVRDNGEGIADSMKPRVFEMFYTGESKIADSRRSLGLGLFLCRSIVNAHGGEISLTDNTPKGSVFTFTVPSSEVNINE